MVVWVTVLSGHVSEVSDHEPMVMSLRTIVLVTHSSRPIRFPHKKHNLGCAHNSIKIAKHKALHNSLPAFYLVILSPSWGATRRTLLTGYDALLQQFYKNHHGALPPDCATPMMHDHPCAFAYLLHTAHTSTFRSMLACLDPRSGFRCSTLWIKPVKLSSHFNNYKSF